MRAAALGMIVLLTVTGCDAFASGEEQAAQACEAFVAERLLSPSTYKRVSMAAPAHQPGEGFRFVSIRYDAANAFGTTIRGAQTCAFKVDKETGRFPDAAVMKSSASLAVARASYAETMRELGKEVPGRPVGALTCCIEDEDQKEAMAGL